MSEYQVVARRYRPKTFSEVVGQDAIVATVKNAVKFDRIAHAYLFCGSRGTGKTTLARLFAKLLNCEDPSEDFEPCNQCPSCKEIAVSSSMDVLEIDGASNRGIEDIRQINETVGYAPSSGRYKIYIIDEVHMLTGAAFNALLKTLEEPPPKVKFFFATTEPHKVLPTILSRCQRFNLARIARNKIEGKLSRVAIDMKVEVAPEALSIISRVADGGMRDAESILDQIVAFSDGKVTVDLTNEILGLMPKDSFFSLDQSGKAGDLNAAFAIAEQIFAEGKDILHYMEELTEHFRTLLLIHLSGKSENDRYMASAKLYSREQLLSIFDILIEAQDKVRFAPSQRVALEMVLLRVIRTHQQIPIEVLVRRLADLESKLGKLDQLPPVKPAMTQELSVEPQRKVTEKAEPLSQPLLESSTPQKAAPIRQPAPLELPLEPQQEVKPLSQPPKAPVVQKTTAAAPSPLKQSGETAVSNKPVAPQPLRGEVIAKQSRYDTILQFAAVELDGTLQKKQVRN
jgi:DNA polymerase-3 subunit gamma/tau